MPAKSESIKQIQMLYLFRFFYEFLYVNMDMCCHWVFLSFSLTLTPLSIHYAQINCYLSIFSTEINNISNRKFIFSGIDRVSTRLRLYWAFGMCARLILILLNRKRKQFPFDKNARPPILRRTHLIDHFIQCSILFYVQYTLHRRIYIYKLNVGWILLRISLTKCVWANGHRAPANDILKKNESIMNLNSIYIEILFAFQSYGPFQWIAILDKLFPSA